MKSNILFISFYFKEENFKEKHWSWTFYLIYLLKMNLRYKIIIASVMLDDKSPVLKKKCACNITRILHMGAHLNRKKSFIQHRNICSLNQVVLQYRKQTYASRTPWLSTTLKTLHDFFAKTIQQQKKILSAWMFTIERSVWVTRRCFRHVPLQKDIASSYSE